MLVRLARPLLFRYRFADARKLPNIWDINPNSYNQMANALFGAYSCQAFGILLKENLTSITDQQVAYALIRINELKLDADDHFYDSIVPVIKDFVANFNKEHSVSLAQIVAACGQLNAKDNTLWEMFEHKLIKEKLYRYLYTLIRYIPLNDLVEMTIQVAKSEHGSKKFF